MKRSFMLRASYVVCTCFCIITSFIFFVLRDDVRIERDILDRSYGMLMNHEVERAGAQIVMLDSLLLWRLRAWARWYNPYERFLRGTIKLEQGEYTEAIHYLQESQESCLRGGFNEALCKELRVETLFRQANALMLSQGKRTKNMAMKYYEEGLRLDPDDMYAKKSLDWLKVIEENAEHTQKSKKIHRGSDTFEKNNPSLQESDVLRKGY